MGDKLRNNRGETLVELLASILIAALSVTLLFSSVAVSTHMGRTAEEADKRYYVQFSEAEAQETAVRTATVTVKTPTTSETSVPVNLYGSEGLYSYAVEKAEAGP